MANGIDWAVTSVAIMRIGATLVPLSTLLRPPEVEAQLRTAGVAALIAQPEYRGRRYLDELDDHIPGLLADVLAGARHARLPNLRHVWSADALPAALGPRRRRRRRRAVGAPGRRPRRHVHLGQPEHARRA